ncbi:MAG: metal-dependent transcriptional regulator [Bacilli bacterium]|nr:metal-dependent transcriptional regulator [Bacilli bacterium]
MKLYESAQDYLERILVLTKQNNEVRSIDLANDMGYTKQSISRAIKKLKNDGLINVDQNGFLSLTEKGLNISSKIYERHLIISKFLMSLGVSEEIAKKDACKMEHDISDEAFEAFKKYLNQKK